MVLRSAPVHDFGARLIDAADRTRDFEASFRFSSAGSQPLALECFNPKPCCASVAVEPATLRPGESALLTVSLRVPFRTGAFSFPAKLRCPATQQEISVALQGQAALGVELTLPPAPGGQWSVSPAEPRALRCEVAQRVLLGEAIPPLAVEASVPARLSPRDELAEPPYQVSRHWLDLTLAASDEDVPQRAAIVVKETTGRQFSALGEATWRLAPFLTPAPAALVLKGAGAGEVELASSDGVSFRILSVAAPGWLSCPLPSAALGKHSLKLHCVGTTAGPQFGKVEFRTDHPRQKSVFVTVAALGPAPEGGT